MAERTARFTRTHRACSKRSSSCRCCPPPASARCPQTKELREARARFKKGEIDATAYERVPGRRDRRRDALAGRNRHRRARSMASSSATTWWNISASSCPALPSPSTAWVQSYGSRCVKPPIIFGDVCRPEADDGRLDALSPSRYTDKPVKGMLTGPVTILQWCFVRDDQPRARNLPPDRARHPRRSDGPGKGRREDHPDRRSRACAKACRSANPNGRPISTGRWKRSGLPPAGVARRNADPHPYVLFGVQRHHRRDGGDGRRRDFYRDLALGDGIAGCLRGFKYPNDIGPGVYDIHSPRVPETAEMENLIVLAPQTAFGSRRSGSIPIAA